MNRCVGGTLVLVLGLATEKIAVLYRNMMELTAVGIALSGVHFAAVYLGTDVLRLDYPQILALNVGFTIVMSLILRASMPAWKPKVEAVVKSEAREGDAFLDVIGMFLAFIVGGIATATLMYRRYGIGGWMGMVGSSIVANWLV